MAANTTSLTTGKVVRRIMALAISILVGIGIHETKISPDAMHFILAAGGAFIVWRVVEYLFDCT